MTGRQDVTEIIQARPTTYKGVRMRSRLEADYAAWLDSTGYRWEYEPECFASTDGQWLPDFGSTFADEGPLGIFTEVKPAGPLRDLGTGTEAWIEHVDNILKRMAITWASRPEATLSLVFWDYEATDAHLHVFCAGKSALWWARHDGSVELLWSGMGQYERLRNTNDDAEVRLACVIARSHWQCSCGCDVRGEEIKPEDVCPHLRALGASPRHIG